MGFALTGPVEAAIRTHAIGAFPEECCGIVVDGEYLRCENVAAEPKSNFRIDGAELVQKTTGRKLEAIVHSHPTTNAAPSSNDMKAQISSKLPFVIVPTNGETCGPAVVFGTGVDIAPLVGRPFIHGVSDCYSAVRDVFRLGKNAVAEQGFDEWPFDPIDLVDVARDDGWWGEPGKPGADLYMQGLAPAGFTKIARDEIRPGDAFLCKIRSDQFNHAGLLVSRDLLFHHLPGRLSRREPAGLWARAAEMWVRYVGASNAA